ncbi:uncharacterized [Tachysurus ichikawai]
MACQETRSLSHLKIVNQDYKEKGFNSSETLMMDAQMSHRCPLGLAWFLDREIRLPVCLLTGERLNMWSFCLFPLLMLRPCRSPPRISPRNTGCV